jgi:hypothetical protein
MAPLGVIRPIALPLTSVNQTFPSGPNAMLKGPAFDVGIENSEMVCIGKFRLLNLIRKLPLDWRPDYSSLTASLDQDDREFRWPPPAGRGLILNSAG